MILTVPLRMGDAQSLTEKESFVKHAVQA